MHLQVLLVVPRPKLLSDYDKVVMQVSHFG